MNDQFPKVESKANNDSIKSHAVIVDGKEFSNLKIVLFAVGNRSKTYVVMMNKKEAGWTAISPNGMRISQAREWISRKIFEQRKARK